MKLGKTKRVRYDAFSVVEKDGNGVGQKGLLASESENCQTGESLKTGVGVHILLRPDGSGYGIGNTTPVADYYFFLPSGESGKYGFVTKKGLVFLDNGTKPLSRYDFTVRTGGTLVFDSENNAKMAFASEKGVFLYDEQSGMVQVNNTPVSTAVCFFNERLFCVEQPFTLIYSAPTEPSNFECTVDGGGRIALPTEKGKIVALCAFKEYLYVFYEYGISRLQGAGSGKDFCVESLPYSGGRIFGGSVGACENKIFFLTENGLFAFDGTNIQRACANLGFDIKTGDQVCAHATADGKYYLRYQGGDDKEKGLVVDGATGQGYHSFAMTGLSACKGEALCYENAGFCRLRESDALPSGEKAYFTANNLSFGVLGVKTLKSLRFFGHGSARVFVSAGGRTRESFVDMSTGCRDAFIGVRGQAFTLKIQLDKDTEIRAIEAEVVA